MKRPERFRPIVFAIAAAFLPAGCARLFDRPAGGEPYRPNPAVIRAMESMLARVPEAAADPTRPAYHFSAPAQWMNDINGVLHYKGFYHIFYQFNPYSDQWGTMHWGHARSRDLVHWEHLPIALWPSREKGEEHVFSGCLTLNAANQPIIFYTSIGHPLPEQWAALGSEDLLVWEKYAGNPILKMDNHGGLSIEEWRDPFVFRAHGKTYLVLGGRLPAGEGSPAAAFLYEARQDDLLTWAYRGILFRHPDPKLHSIECPNFFPLDGRFVLLISPYGPVEYFVGDFDAKQGTFRAHRRGLADYGEDFYGTNVLIDRRGRRILLGWLRGFQNTKGWNGCMSLPRILTLTDKGELLQTPAPELKSLRGPLWQRKQILLENQRIPLDIRGKQLEIKMKIAPAGAGECGLIVRCKQDGTGGLAITRQADRLTVGGREVPLPDNEPVELHLFLDNSVVEIFINNGRQCISRVLAPCPEQDSDYVCLFSNNGQAYFKSIRIWKLNSIDKQASLPHK
ncbi:MAG TPA: glycoside hydrolase family 32 protein [Anaerohalosphaeraceae bacterium]|nr:glycoside hydrolase family 32 protein [Anaerohalosphaeraceae bacterium]HOL89491.1 glycoside hydrolase family 32 protein [Anaerohalosphaeraceae bacterium]HPP57120.1 glycoside hydrolase family 32 protein [Anaerohalosphaeraceae bacterium]